MGNRPNGCNCNRGSNVQNNPIQDDLDNAQLALRDRSVAVPRVASAPTADRQALVESLMASFDAQEASAGEDLAGLRSELKAALDHAAEHVDGDPVVPPRGEWVQAVEALHKVGAVSEDETNDLIRRLDEAMRPLQQDNVQRALEFGRRCRHDGEESALAWLRNQPSL